MERSNKPPGKRKPSRVEVIYFPRAKAKPALVQPAPPDPSVIPTMPGVTLGEDELATEPAFFPDMAELERVSRRHTPSQPSGARPPKGGGRRRRTRTPVETPAVPNLHTYKDHLVRLKAPRLSRSSLQKLTEVLSVFGHEMFESGKVDVAREVFEALVAARAEDAFVLTMLGTILLAAGQLSRAGAQFEAALRLEPHYVPALVYRGELGLRRGSVRSAQADLKRAISLGQREDPFLDRAKQLLAASAKLKRPKG